ncbi:alpha-N-arabinofuranosidase [Mucilaginibacter sp. PPCGB 2223]|uniref:family 43 glycosylhydrolase n=1 Tax=Mucilaginibacter sp. PPCGB 2223 TaxID=1886027 RepID=UPI0008241283|nr:family 43 glycosylhydrolase [Mucilaginibacter sp. PPCGB 2223]OCX52999.1 alpha-N-arabinofuranosidase [Mucilaginibacter sp. PPCGB 2223]
MRSLKIITVAILSGTALSSFAQNPLITDQFTADPSARVFNGRVYVYPSHDIKATKGHGRAGWFNMADYHVFSSQNLTDWTDHGVILTQQTVPWADSTSYSMWAPDCIDRNGKYYLYFPTNAKAGVANGRGFAVGVAISDRPEGPFKAEPDPIKGIHGIDPNVIIDKDGQAYIYYAQGNLYGAKLKSNMLELDGDPVILKDFPTKGLKEGPYVFERDGTYYMTYPHVENKIERLEYATSKNPLGPFTFTGVLMDESASGCWTNHQSVIQYKGQWYLFYHNDDLSPNFDKNRSIHADSLFFNADGTIRKVIPTLRGVGLTRSNKEIQIDRYSDMSKTGVAIDFIDTAHRMQGWKTTFSQAGGWVRYNAVEFSKKPKTVTARIMGDQPGNFEVHLDQPDGLLVGTIKSFASTDWKEVKTAIAKSISGKHDLFIVSKSSGPSAVDWVKFE